MGWWPFSKPKSARRVIDPIMKDGRTWLLELRDMCERNFDNPEEAKRRIRQMQVAVSYTHLTLPTSDLV